MHFADVKIFFRHLSRTAFVVRALESCNLQHVTMIFRASHNVCGAMRLECCGWAVVTSPHCAAPRGSCGMVDRCLHSSTLCHPSHKLTNSRWEGHPATIRSTAFALCFSTAEHACSTKKDCNWMQQANTCMCENVSLLVAYHVFQLVMPCSCSPGHCTI